MLDSQSSQDHDKCSTLVWPVLYYALLYAGPGIISAQFQQTSLAMHLAGIVLGLKMETALATKPESRLNIHKRKLLFVFDDPSAV